MSVRYNYVQTCYDQTFRFYKGTGVNKIPKLHVARKPPNMQISDDATLTRNRRWYASYKNTVKESEDTRPHERQRVI